MELNDILEKLSLPQDLTRRGFLKAASAAAALGLLNDARAKNGVRPYVILETAKGLIIADPNLCVACHRCELACTEFNDGKATPRLARSQRPDHLDRSFSGIRHLRLHRVPDFRTDPLSAHQYGRAASALRSVRRLGGHSCG